MKNASPRKEKHENMPSMYIPSEGREVKSVFQDLSHQINRGQAGVKLESRIPGVIFCNSELTNTFRTLRTRSSLINNSGHNIQKALNSVTEKSRSQSLPSCLEGKKFSCVSRDDNNKIPVCSNEPHESKEVGIITVKVGSVGNNETWFRTWPERGSDKVASPHNNVPNDTFDKGDDCLGCEEERNLHSENDHSNYEDNAVTNVGDVCKSVFEINSCCGLTADKSSKLDTGTHSLKTGQNFPINSLLWKSDLSSNCDKDNYSSVVQHSSSIRPTCTYESTGVNASKAPIPLTELLQNIPIAYSPVTRQLHIINPSDTLQQQSPDLNKQKRLECIEEEGVGAVKCSEEDSLSFESPRSTLQRVCVGSLSRTDASSFSSIVSSLSDASPSSNNDDPDDLSTTTTTHCSPSGSGDSYYEEMGGTKSKKKGISGFFSRNVFVWKSSQDAQNNNSSGSCGNNSSGGSTPGWKLFGRLVSKPSENDITSNPETGWLPDAAISGGKRYEDVVASSSALILHNRPSNLPAKSHDEEQKHRQEYQQMVEAARKKELKEAKQRKKQLQKQLKIEEQLANAARIWNNEILPKWDIMKTSRKARDLWWQGIPPSVRGKVWKLAIGNDLNVTHQLYNICLTRAQERLKAAVTAQAGDNVDKEASMELIQLDIARTFPHLCIFQRMNAYYAAYNDFFRENLPRLHTHFTNSSLSADLYLLDWLYTVFAKAMPLDVACRVWDVFLRDGEEFLFKAALGVLHLHQDVLLRMDFIHGAQFLTKLPDDLVADQLFRSIEAIHMNVGKQKFGEVLAQHIDRCQQESS
ncbi:TBC1 domain family member 14-like isoform X2 [Periplaneta americana]|uniref:TBC1 domain family member 14-like isoform X2 n=1 Tax=Periplaneta americana TaxID=6978 RepID=UPI0037E83BB8